jgi:hypothetical protein
MSSRPPRTPRDLTHVVGEIQQKLSRRKRPSLPAVSMEGATKGRAKPVVEPVAIPERHHVVEVNTTVGAGQDRSRAPQRRAQTLVESQYDLGHYQWEQEQVAKRLRDLVARLCGLSEGVANYAGETGSGAPWEKGDRKALAVIENANVWKEFTDLILVMAEIPSRDPSRKQIDEELAVFLVRACTETVDRITLAEIGLARSEYGTQSRQEAVGSAVISEALRKGVGYLGYAKAPEFRRGFLQRLIYGPDK